MSPSRLKPLISENFRVRNFLKEICDGQEETAVFYDAHRARVDEPKGALAYLRQISYPQTCNFRSLQSAPHERMA